MIKKIISGGQTGADRAGLDFAIEQGIAHGGWIPKGRITENGPLPAKYKLREMTTTSYPKRTERNIIDSDGTLVLSHGNLSGGSLLTEKLAAQHKRPLLHLDLNKLSVPEAAKILMSWLAEHKVAVLNVAGPRASKDPRVYEETKKVLRGAIRKYSLLEGGIHETNTN